MSELKVIDFVKKNYSASFEYYRAGFLYYSVIHIPTDENYLFPIPLEDTGNGTFEKLIDAITLMRWIRKAIEDNTIQKI